MSHDARHSPRENLYRRHATLRGSDVEGKKKMLLKELETWINEKISLRKPNDAKIVEYAERMAEGVKFPPIKLGRWPVNEKYGEVGIVDGLHRVAAASQTKITELDVEHILFKSLEDALLYMYTSNMAHGLPVSETSRNKRMQLLKKIDPKLGIAELSKQFGVSKSSVDRILKGEQGEGKSGPKGPNKSAAHGSAEPMKPKAFITALEKMDFTFQRVRQTKDIIEYFSPSTTDEPEGTLDTEKFVLLEKVRNHLTQLLKTIQE